MAARRASTLEAVLRRDRAILLAALTVLTLLAWGWIIAGAGMDMSALDMSRLALFPHLAPAALDGMAMEGGGAAMATMPAGTAMAGTTPAPGWTSAHTLLMVSMWWIMMIAMMLPSAAPMILLHARTLRHAQGRGRLPAAPIPTAWFLAGYLAAWLGFAVAAVAAQAALERSGLISAMMLWSDSRYLTAGLLGLAALYQLSPLKRVCLAHCRAPAEYLSAHWRPGAAGAFRMGLGHGAYCVGCCWALMALLFAGGVMNLAWIAALTLLVLAEKAGPGGPALGTAAAIVLALWAAATLAIG